MTVVPFTPVARRHTEPTDAEIHRYLRREVDPVAACSLLAFADYYFAPYGRDRYMRALTRLDEMQPGQFTWIERPSLASNWVLLLAWSD